MPMPFDFSMLNEQQFCGWCGKKQTGIRVSQTNIGSMYDHRDGKRFAMWVCENPKCRQGCNNLGEHPVRRPWWKFWKYCVECGQ